MQEVYLAPKSSDYHSVYRHKHRYLVCVCQQEVHHATAT